MRVSFSQPSTDYYRPEQVRDVIRTHSGGVGIFIGGELAALHTPTSLIVEGNLRADTKHGGKISFTLSHHAMSEAVRDWSAFEGRAMEWTGEALSFSHITGSRVSTFIGRDSSDALVGVDVATPGGHVAGVLGGVHTPVDGEIEITDGALTHVSKYTDSAAVLDVHAGGDTFAWVHVSPSWSDFRLSDEVVSGVYDFYRGGSQEKRVTLHAASGSFFWNDVQQSLLDRVTALEDVIRALTENI